MKKLLILLVVALSVITSAFGQKTEFLSIFNQGYIAENLPYSYAYDAGGSDIGIVLSVKDMVTPKISADIYDKMLKDSTDRKVLTDAMLNGMTAGLGDSKKAMNSIGISSIKLYIKNSKGKQYFAGTIWL